MKLVAATIAGIFCFSCATIFAQEDPRVVRPVRISQAPVIDGILNDDIWKTITPITAFIQREPTPGEPGSERTEVRIAYDSQNLYFAIRAYDSEPEKLIGNIFERDSELFLDDSILIAIDSNNDNRTSFMFESNSNGARTDAQITENIGANNDYNPIWTVRANVDDQGYTLEIEIPFFVLRFKPSEEVSMGLVMRRLIRRKNEEVFWPIISRDYDAGYVSQYGEMVGFRGLERGVDVELKPAVIFGRSEFAQNDEYNGDVSFDAKWGISSNLTADFTANTDFAQVESDELQVNLTRFNLFYPEKRDFFLESSDLFQFGPRLAQAFFSRRIGIRGNQEIPIIGGSRLYGLVGDTNIGLMSMRTDAVGGLDGETFSVARVKQNLFDRSYIGGIITDRRGLSNEQDTTVGMDFEHVFGVNSSLFGSIAKSNRPNIDSGEWFYYGTASYDTDKLFGRISYIDVGENYNPGIGFVARPDQRNFALTTAYKPRPDFAAIRQLLIRGDYTRIENHAGILESEETFFRFITFFETDDLLEFAIVENYEYVPFPFEIAPGIFIPSGEYNFIQGGLYLGTFSGRRFYMNASYNTGSFYGGTYQNMRADLGFKVSPRFHIDMVNVFNMIDLPGGEFDANIHRLFASYFFSPTLTTRLAAQFSSLEEELLLNFRMRWIFAPGSEAWLVYDEGRRFDIPGESLRDRSIILKVVYNFHL